MKQDTFSKHFATVLKEMCERVKCDYAAFDFDREEWYKDYSWTVKEQDDYEKWLIGYMKKNKEARQEFMNIPSAQKTFLEKFVKSFTLSWGWKIKFN